MEVDKKFKDLEAYKKKLAEIDAKKAKDIEEKLAKLKEQGIVGNQNKGLLEVVVEK